MIIGAPSLPMHLPAAEPILPGHTLIRPALGMLKSSVKFPHREMDNGAGVYGNINNLGIRYDGRNERVKYTDFRRSGGGGSRRSLADYILVSPSKPSRESSRPGFTLANLALDMNRKKDAELRVLNLLKKIQKPVKNDVQLIMYIADPQNSPLYLKDLYQTEDNEIDKEQYQSEEIIPQIQDVSFILRNKRSFYTKAMKFFREIGDEGVPIVKKTINFLKDNGRAAKQAIDNAYSKVKKFVHETYAQAKDMRFTQRKP
ncbi:uncharacterized protein LOC126379541 [Pectinophora gossypiella]|uniref:uncharacterized protein LOC126379541 n=1 Tax=Pectinophora gossypiella TaxID=13191 RepID=UPI00214E0E50|nr:uncharacterized protein LOC126379541 [Pectinophora gossypiella]